MEDRCDDDNVVEVRGALIGVIRRDLIALIEIFRAVDLEGFGHRDIHRADVARHRGGLGLVAGTIRERRSRRRNSHQGLLGRIWRGRNSRTARRGVH